MKQTIKFVKLSSGAKVPAKAHSTDSGFDICSDENLHIPPHSSVKVSTGIAAVIPEGFELQVRPRSGLASRGIVAAFGTVDQGYRGVIGVSIYNHSDKTATIVSGDRIAQLVLAPVVDAEAVEGDPGDLTPTDRGSSGFGSTGK